MMDRVGRAIAIAFITSSLSFAAACAGPPPTSNQNANQPSSSQPATPLILPKNQSQPGLGSIKVGSRPVGAAIMLIPEGAGGAGQPERRGSTPATIVDLAPGKYTVHLELRPYKPFQKSVEVKPDQTTTVTAELTK